MSCELGLVGNVSCQTQSPCCLRRGTAAAVFLRLRVRIPTEEWMSLVFVERCVLSGRYIVPRNPNGIT